MALCMGQAGMGASQSATAGDIPAGQEKLALGHSCMGASTLLYTVGESAVSLYEDYLLANSDLQQKANETVVKCTEILKKLGPPK